MVNARADLEHEEILFHTPGRLAGALPYALQVAGLGLARPGQEPVRKRYHDHVLLFALAGQGRVEIGGAVHVVEPGQVLWLDTSRPYAHGAAGAEPWRYLWMGQRGTGLDGLHGLLDVQRDPVFAPGNGRSVAAAFERVLDVARGTDTGGDAAANAAIAAILGELATQRLGSTAAGATTPDLRIASVVEALQADPVRDWTIEVLAKRTGLSGSQLFRRFRQATGTTPMDFLRQTRITASKHLLSQTALAVSEIAARCGYRDPYHFSRDFRRLTGTSPSRFRSWFR